jgi:tRNA G46 methylase TrmB
MKKTIKNILKQSMKSALIWNVVQPVVRVSAFMKNARKSHEKSVIKSKSNVQNPFDTLIVRNGPFKGMIYPEYNSHGSALIPKLLGSYEKEIHTSVVELCKKDYQVIINIGCGEGYYAIGLGLLKPNASIIAYDIKAEARLLCNNMAELNGISQRVTVKENFEMEDLKKIDKKSDVLIICDCEGYEKNIFNDENIEDFANCDIIIETHDFIDIEISSYLKNLFKETHSLESIYSIDDIQKALTYNYKELEDLTLIEKKRCLAENRPIIMEWLVCKKNSK